MKAKTNNQIAEKLNNLFQMKWNLYLKMGKFRGVGYEKIKKEDKKVRLFNEIVRIELE